MTEGRFKIIDENENLGAIRDTVQKKEIAVLLNELYEENQQYKDLLQDKEINELEQILHMYLFKIYNFIDSIYPTESFNDEFHKGCSIKNVAVYILNDHRLFLKHASFLLDFIDKFLLLCKYKSSNIYNFTDSEVKKEYNKLSVDFRKCEMYFYTHIYQPSGNYDEEFLENIISRIMKIENVS